MTNICNVKFKTRSLAVSIGLAVTLGLGGCGGDSATNTDTSKIDTSQPVSDWKMVWSDEFDGNAIDANKWTHEVNCSGGGNNEQQCYTESSDNSFVSEGMLNIVALPNTDSTLSKDYTSARLNSKMKGDWTYGRFEARVKLPSGQGSFPAVWMMPTDDVYGGWPHSGEIDIVESVNLKASTADGNEESYVHGTLHYGKSWPDNSESGKSYLMPDGVNPADDFHTYAIEWQEGEIRWYVDGYLYQTQRKSEVKYNFQGFADGLLHKGWYTNNFDIITGEEQNAWTNAPYDQNFFMILNFAVGGDWAESVNELGVDASAFANGNTMLVDYVRVYECEIAPMTGEGCDTLRAGYNIEPTEALPDGALQLGAAPNPPPAPLAPNAPAPPLVIFETEIQSGWDAWDCCGGSTPSIEIDSDTQYGEVVEFAINGDTVVGFSTRAGHGVIDGSPFNASNMVTTGTVEFDLKMTTAPAGGDTSWMFKIESDEASTAVEVPLSTSVEGHTAPELGVWQHYSFNIADLTDAGLDPSQIDVLMIFPAWGSGDGAAFSVDNVVISKPDGDSGPSANVTIFDETNQPNWLAWDCCAGSTPTVEVDDSEHNNVIEFAIGGDTVMGFSTRDGHGATDGVPFDASTIITGGTVSFDLKMTTSPGDTTWMFKIESDEAVTAVEVPLSTSNEGHAAPELGVWQTYTFNIVDLVDAGLDPTAIDVVMIFPAWGTGTGAVYRVDNVIIADPNASETPDVSVLEEIVFDETNRADWLAWDCCAGSTPTVEVDDASHNNVIEFAIGGDTVMGFSSRAGHGAVDGTPFDATNIVASGTISFDLKMTTSPGDTTWMFKVESDEATTAVEIPLSTSNEGHAAPELGVWQTYTFNIVDLFDAGLDPTAIDVLMIFPAWGTGTGAVYRVDNVRIGG